jgi:hypothetical protein
LLIVEFVGCYEPQFSGRRKGELGKVNEMSNISEAQDKVSVSWRVLNSQWVTTQQDWRDSVREQFEKEYWKRLESEVPRLLGTMQSLDRTLDQALRNTESD